MSQPLLKFGSISLAPATIYSKTSNRDAFIQVRASYVQGTNTATVYEDRSGYFGSASIQVGYDLSSVGEVTTPVGITGWDPNTKVITFDGVAEATKNGITKINIPEGMLFIESASFSKIGGGTLNPPNTFRDVTGSLDSEYDSSNLKWGVIGQLASTSSITIPQTGMYSQYEITSFSSRTGTSQADIFLTASNTISAFIEPNGYSLASDAGISSLLLSEISSGLMSIAGSGDIAGNQSLGLAAYQTAVASTLSPLVNGGGSGAGFPFSGSAHITGSLIVTGSTEFLKDPGSNEDFFLIKSASFSSLKMNRQGIPVFGNFTSTPDPVAGGLIFSASSFYAGLE